MKNFTLLSSEELKTLLTDVVRTELQSHIPGPVEPYKEFPDLLTRAQASKMLGVSLATIDNWSKTGRITKYHIGSTSRFKKEELIASLENLQRFQRPI